MKDLTHIILIDQQKYPFVAIKRNIYNHYDFFMKSETSEPINKTDKLL
jgi:hypothetical protein